MRLTLSEIKKKAKEVIPDGIPYTVELEAGTIALITPTPDVFSEKGNALTVKLAKAIRRRIVVRPDSSILAKEEDVMATVKELLPEEAGLRLQSNAMIPQQRLALKGPILWNLETDLVGCSVRNVLLLLNRRRSTTSVGIAERRRPRGEICFESSVAASIDRSVPVLLGFV